MQPTPEPAYAALFRLFHDGTPLESIRSGWRLGEEKIAELLLAGHRAGEKIDPDWLLPATLRGRVLDAIAEHPEWGATEISSRFQGKIAPALVRVLRECSGARAGLKTRLFNEETAPAAFDADIQAAKKEVIVVTPHVKGRHWLRHQPYWKRVQDTGGTVALFAATVSDIVKEDLLAAGIVLIEKRTNANLAILDGAILWEGSWSMLAPPAAEEHVRRTESRLQCDEVKDLHDLYL